MSRAEDAPAAARERPILFAGPMVQAILEGRKTQTRRVVKDAHGAFWDHAGYRPVVCGAVVGWVWAETGEAAAHAPHPVCPYGQPGDRLWVRETWRGWNATAVGVDLHHVAVDYQADGSRRTVVADSVQRRQARVVGSLDVGVTRDPWRPSIFMPRWASRITLEVVAVRVERLQEIAEADAEAEGMQRVEVVVRHLGEKCGGGGISVRAQFKAGWDSINGKRAPWDSNPWVWVVTFTRSVA